MKKKNTFLAVALLLAVVLLGVGYAAATGPWVVNGTATAEANEGFDVAFTAVDNEDLGRIVNDVTAEMEVSLKEVDEYETVTFTLTNNSPIGIGAEIDPDSIVIKYEAEDGTVTADESEFFLITHQLGETTIDSNGGTTTLAVTVKLKQAALAEVTEKFTVSIGTITAVQE